MASEETIRQEALDWAVRCGDPAFTDWDAFMAWLEADPAHARAYDRASAAAADAADLIAANAPANDDSVHDALPARPRRFGILGGIAAALAVVAGLWAFQQPGRDLYTVQTAMGETRRVTLDVDTRVELAGGSSVTFDRADKRYAKLEHGQALFTVRHDAAHPFEVAVGDELLRDIGTVFDVRHDEAGLRVAVSEGAVEFDPEGAAVRIAPGEMLQRATGASDYALSKIAPTQVGEWRQGRLTFDSASLAEVALQLKRATGIDYAPGKEGTAISGSILVDPLRRDPAAIGPLLGVSVQKRDGRWMIGSR